MLVVVTIIISFFCSSLYSCANSSISQKELTESELTLLFSLFPSFNHFLNILETSQNIDEFYLLFKQTSKYSDKPAVAKFQTLAINQYQKIASDPENTEKLLTILIENREIRATILYCHIMNKQTQSTISSLFNGPACNSENQFNLSISYFKNLIPNDLKGEITGLNQQELKYVVNLIGRLNINSPAFSSQISVQVRDWYHSLNY
jgi:hypothetical protein